MGAKIEEKQHIFEFFEISYTFTLNFLYKIWPSEGGQMTSQYSQFMCIE